MSLKFERRWAVFISGRGSNLAALLQESREDLNIRLVVSSSASAYGLKRASRAGVPTMITPLIAGSKKTDWPRLTADLRAMGITHVALAGFMKIVPKVFVDAWLGRISNLHPSMLPLYPGLHSIERAREDGESIGLTVHDVNEQVDAGNIYAQRVALSGASAKLLPLAWVEFLTHVEEQRIFPDVLRRSIK